MRECLIGRKVPEVVAAWNYSGSFGCAPAALRSGWRRRAV